jgi:hypothetical protein
MRPAPHHHDNRVPTDLRRLIPVAAPYPLVLAWRWRYEIALLSGLSAGLATAVISFGVLPAIVAMIVITLTILCWPTARRFAVDRAWCIITPHRVRAGCAEGLIYSSRGKIPIILWTSHVRAERFSLSNYGATIEDWRPRGHETTLRDHAAGRRVRAHTGAAYA